MKVGLIEVRVTITDATTPYHPSVWAIAIQRLHEQVDELTQKDVIILDMPDTVEIDEDDDEYVSDPVGEPE